MSVYRLNALISLMLMIIILMPEAEHAKSNVFRYERKRQAEIEVRKYCGDNLSSALQRVCAGVYNTPFKKSNQEMEMDDYMAYNYDLHPYKSIENARRMLRFRRNSPGVHEECCSKPCSTEEIRSYCGTR
ncbi:LIRP protein [Habropoda laboriosa]|uniref:LIRP protein n=1 Tax=Habropoda laboriosa TaxID=597456 RepID=A0A0L7R8T8_9HYME|nr:PREDICTED: LIRP [Habropoda laboriosa]KOC67243.1 LIRP protein [Habropoda laboriosa]